MILPFDELQKHEFSLSDIKVMLQSPQYRFLAQKNRLCNGFLYILEIDRSRDLNEPMQWLTFLCVYT